MDIDEMTLQILLKAMDNGSIKLVHCNQSQGKEHELSLQNIATINSAYNSIYDNLYSKIVSQK